ncbi:hypothetical protein FACS189449_02630 [Alphaproteobacteria bacterium]|nr:hypothetical protein FACS189449_02630 [Alphaproteobacteria bacterium]
MNKTLIACSSFVIALFFSADASLTVAGWYSFLCGDNAVPQSQPTHFNESTDLINGQVLLSSGLVKTHRFFGPAKYNRFYEKGNPASYADTSGDPMTKVLICLFPSAGLNLNASGKGSISESFGEVDVSKEGMSDEEKRIVQEKVKLAHNKVIKFIATMFAVADCVREESISDEKRAEIVDESLRSYKEKMMSNKGKEDKKSAYSVDKSGNLKKAKKSMKERNGQKKQYAAVVQTPIKRGDFLEKHAGQYFKERLEEAKTSINGKKVESLKALGENKLARATIEAIANAVGGESRNNFVDGHPYPPGYVNHLISAYAWSVLEKQDLILLNDELPKARRMISETFGGTLPESRANVLDISITEEMNNYEKSYTQYMPLRPSDSIITNGTATYKGNAFADCVDTVLRQFFITMLCQRTEGKLSIDRIKLPPDLKKKDFFRDSEAKPSDYANSGLSSVRTNWANVASNLPGVSYCKSTDGEKYEMKPGWINLIKAFCRLMDGCMIPDGSERVKEAIETIKSVNERKIFGEGAIITPQNVVNVLNSIMRIREDVVLVAELDGDIANKKDKPILQGDLYCAIKIYPKSDNRESSDVRNNTMEIDHSPGHAQVRMRDGTRPQPVPDSSRWIKLIYNALVVSRKLYDLKIFNNCELLEYFAFLHFNVWSESEFDDMVASKYFKQSNDGILRGVSEGFYDSWYEEDGWYHRDFLEKMYQPKKITKKCDAVDKLIDAPRKGEKVAVGESKEYKTDASMILCNTQKELVAEAAAEAVACLQNIVANGTTTDAERGKVVSRQEEIANAALIALHINKTDITNEGDLNSFEKHIYPTMDNLKRIVDVMPTNTQDNVDSLITHVLKKIPAITGKTDVYGTIHYLTEKLKPSPLNIKKEHARDLLRQLCRFGSYCDGELWDSDSRSARKEVKLISEMLKKANISLGDRKDTDALIEFVHRDEATTIHDKYIYDVFLCALIDRKNKIDAECTKYLLTHASREFVYDILVLTNIDLDQKNNVEDLVNAAADKTEDICRAVACLINMGNRKIDAEYTKYLLQHVRKDWIETVLDITSVDLTQQKNLEDIIRDINADEATTRSICRAASNAIHGKIDKAYAKYLLEHVDSEYAIKRRVFRQI